jgi:hypothetical protein
MVSEEITKVKTMKMTREKEKVKLKLQQEKYELVEVSYDYLICFYHLVFLFLRLPNQLM